MVGLTAVSGCVVTDKVEFHEPVNSPPVFPLSEQPSKLQLGDHIFVDKRDELGWTFTFRVRDADIDQDLDVQWRILRNIINPGSSMVTTEQRWTMEVPPSGTDTRDFVIDVEPGQLVFDNCHRVEIGVSGSFEPRSGQEAFLQRDSDDRADIAQFSFWIWEGDPTAPAAAKLVQTCGATSFEPTVPTGAAGAAAEQAP